jgi:hypothetical protein
MSQDVAKLGCLNAVLMFFLIHFFFSDCKWSVYTDCTSYWKSWRWGNTRKARRVLCLLMEKGCYDNNFHKYTLVLLLFCYIRTRNLILFFIQTPKFCDILWHPTKNYCRKVFLLTKITPEYSEILCNPTHYPAPLVLD